MVKFNKKIIVLRLLSVIFIFSIILHLSPGMLTSVNRILNSYAFPEDWDEFNFSTINMSDKLDTKTLSQEVDLKGDVEIIVFDSDYVNGFVYPDDPSKIYLNRNVVTSKEVILHEMGHLKFKTAYMIYEILVLAMLTYVSIVFLWARPFKRLKWRNIFNGILTFILMLCSLYVFSEWTAELNVILSMFSWDFVIYSCILAVILIEFGFYVKLLLQCAYQYWEERNASKTNTYYQFPISC